MKFFTSALVALSSVSFASARCCVPTETLTELDFYDSTVEFNLLHEPGGNITYAGVGVYQNDQINLVVKVVDDPDSDYDYSEIEQVWIDRGKPVPNNNGKRGSFGTINLQTIRGIPDSGKGTFEFCLRDEDGDLVTLPSHTFSVYDADQRGANRPIVEKMEVDLTANGPNPGITSVQLGFDPSEIVVGCKDPSETPVDFVCQNSETVYHSSTPGVGSDNPSDPATMTDLQLARSVQFYFENTACWYLTYNHYCPYEQEDYEGEPGFCSGYTGGNFLFAGYSRAISEHGGCTPTHPTDAPTDGPDPAPPTPAETADPTTSPTASPTSSPTSSPTASPTSSPTSSPTASPTASPTSSPTASPTASPTEAPSASPVDPRTTPECPADIELVAQNGVTKIDMGSSIEIVERDGDKATVKLTNTWGDDLDIYYQYKPDYLNEKCFAADGVKEGATYAEIELQCFHTKAFTELEICVTDDCTIHLSPDDDAVVPQCCDTDGYSQAVCYKLIIWCEDQCPTTPDRQRALQALRGHA